MFKCVFMAMVRLFGLLKVRLFGLVWFVKWFIYGVFVENESIKTKQ